MAVPLLLLLLAAPATPQFSCPADQQGVFPDPDQCDKYWECGPGGRAGRHLCPDGLAFHPSKPEGEDPCDHIHAVPDRCKKRPKLQKAKPGKTDQCRNCPISRVYLICRVAVGVCPVRV